MDTKGKAAAEGVPNSPARTDKKQPASLVIARQGIHTGRQFAQLMSALMTDLIEGKITPGVGNAACNAGGKLLKVVEMQAKYGQTNGAATSGEKVLYLTGVPGRTGEEPPNQ